MADLTGLNEFLLDLALQRNLAGFQQSLKRIMGRFDLAAWAVVFPAGSAAGDRPLFIAHGIRTTDSPLLALAAKQGLDVLFPPRGAEERVLAKLAREIGPTPTSRCRVLRIERERGVELVLFCYRGAEAADFAAGELDLLTRVGRLFDRCFVVLAEEQQQEFQAGLFRLVGNLHPEGLCILDNRLRVIFENRKFKEHMHQWHHGPGALENLSLPKQSELPAVWKEACDRSFQAFREVKFPPTSGRMVVTQGPLSTIKHALDPNQWIEGAVRYLAFQGSLGVRPYLMLTSTVRRKEAPANLLTIDRIAAALSFSRRETQLAELILRGSSAREIADRLKISLPTVKTHIRHILHKAGVKTRLQFVGLCRDPG